MELAGELFNPGLHWWFGSLYLLLLALSIWMADWQRLRDHEQLHVFLGSCVALMLLWSVKVPVIAGLTFHLLGVTTVTLLFGWSLGILCSSIALAGVMLNAANGWGGFFVNAITLSVMPVSLTWLSLLLARAWLPKNFFVYVLFNGFMTAGLVAIVSGYFATWLLVLSGAFTLSHLDLSLLPFFPLMFIPEAIINGWLVTILVLYKPQWVSSFKDELYLKGK
ncbi:MAG: molecular chaperone DnaJ [Ketobacter sp.]|nr:molecular chaperone DnaJ [Ketobacter sp.]